MSFLYSDGEGYGLESEIVQILDLMRFLVSSSRKQIRRALKLKLKELCYFSTGYMQMTVEQIEKWNSDPGMVS